MSQFNNNTSQYPAWTGTSPSRPDLTVNRAPDAEDYDQLTAEILSHQAALVAGFGTPTTALTAANAGTLNTGDATSDTIIGNIRTRVGQIAACLVSHGLLSP